MDAYPAEFYEALHAGTPGDLQHYAHYCADAQEVLELGCGGGRVLAALASTQRSCTGIDTHAGLLALAAQRLGARPGVTLQEQDMRDLDGLGSFDRILLPFCGLYCLNTPQDLDRVLRGVKAHLAPQGRFLLDAYNAELFHLDSDDPDPDQVPHEHGEIEVRGVTYRVFEQSRWDRQQQRIEVSYLHAAADPNAARAAELDDEVVATLPHRYWLREQVESAAARAGLSLREAWGSFEQDAWSPEAPWNVFHFEHAPPDEPR